MKKQRKSSRIRSEKEQDEYMEEGVYRSHKPGKVHLVKSCKHKDRYFGAKSKRKPEIEQKTQLKPTALEVIDYKTGTQGYPQKVKAFEKMVKETGSESHENYMTFQHFLSLEDTRPGKWVFDTLNDLRKRWGLKPGDFSETTKKWFEDHPADLMFISMWEVRKTEAKKWAGFHAGLKGKGITRKRSKRTPEEVREAHKLGQRKRAKEARGK